MLFNDRWLGGCVSALIPQVIFDNPLKQESKHESQFKLSKQRILHEIFPHSLLAMMNVPSHWHRHLVNHNQLLIDDLKAEIRQQPRQYCFDFQDNRNDKESTTTTPLEMRGWQLRGSYCVWEFEWDDCLTDHIAPRTQRGNYCYW